MKEWILKRVPQKYNMFEGLNFDPFLQVPCNSKNYDISSNSSVKFALLFVNSKVERLFLLKGSGKM